MKAKKTEKKKRNKKISRKGIGFFNIYTISNIISTTIEKNRNKNIIKNMNIVYKNN